LGRKADEVLGAGGALTGAAAIVQFQGEQFAQQHRALRLRGVPERVLQQGALARQPGVLEAVTDLVDPPQKGGGMREEG
jgi:hypothetical protein